VRKEAVRNFWLLRPQVLSVAVTMARASYY
jgi:hypothetical protein